MFTYVTLQLADIILDFLNVFKYLTNSYVKLLILSVHKKNIKTLKNLETNDARLSTCV